MFILLKLVILLSTFVVVVRSLPGRGGDVGKPKALEQSTDRLVFAHFMVRTPDGQLFCFSIFRQLTMTEIRLASQVIDEMQQTMMMTWSRQNHSALMPLP